MTSLPVGQAILKLLFNFDDPQPSVLSNDTFEREAVVVDAALRELCSLTRVDATLCIDNRRCLFSFFSPLQDYRQQTFLLVDFKTFSID